MHVLIAEDDEGIANALRRALAAHGHQALTVSDGADAVAASADPTVEMMILDLRLPGLDGLQVLARVRKARAALPILVLTARDELADKVTALDAGADDYLTKPFAMDEFLARVRALSRRTDQPAASRIEMGGLVLDLASRTVERDGRACGLSHREFALLQYLMSHPRQVLTREQILAGVWEYDFDPASNVVDVYVRYLRRKIDRPGEPSLIAAIRGTGYRFDPPGGPSPSP
jgi:DNA-binding response OmpR family regulator